MHKQSINNNESQCRINDETEQNCKRIRGKVAWWGFGFQFRFQLLLL